jgi:hypothetical protein
VSTSREETARQFAAWVEERPVRETQIGEWFFGPPLWARPALTEHVQPYYDQYQDLYHVIAGTLTTDEEGNWEVPSEHYWKPTAPMRTMLRQLETYRRQAYREIPNPAYDETRAEEYWEQQRTRFHTTTMMVGQFYNPMT